MSALIIGLVAIGCFSAGFVFGAVWKSFHSAQPDQDFDWSDFK